MYDKATMERRVELLKTLYSVVDKYTTDNGASDQKLSEIAEALFIVGNRLVEMQKKETK